MAKEDKERDEKESKEKEKYEIEARERNFSNYEEALNKASVFEYIDSENELNNFGLNLNHMILFKSIFKNGSKIYYYFNLLKSQDKDYQIKLDSMLTTKDKYIELFRSGEIIEDNFKKVFDLYYEKEKEITLKLMKFKKIENEKEISFIEEKIKEFESKKEELKKYYRIDY